MMKQMTTAEKILQKIDTTLANAEKLTDKLTFSVNISRDDEGELVVEMLVRSGNEVEKLHNLHPVLGIFGKPITLKQFLKDGIETIAD